MASMLKIEDNYNALFFQYFGTNTGIDFEENDNYTYPDYFSGYSVDSNKHVTGFTAGKINDNDTLLTDCGTQEAYAGSIYLNAKDAQRYPSKGNPEILKNISLENASDQSEYKQYIFNNANIGSAIDTNTIKEQTLAKLKNLANNQGSLVQCGYITSSESKLGLQFFGSFCLVAQKRCISTIIGHLRERKIHLSLSKSKSKEAGKSQFRQTIHTQLLCPKGR